MSRNGTLRAVLGVVVCLLYLAVGEAGAVIIDVPGTELTIDLGIGAASDGDTVRVAPGIYAVNLDFAGKSVCLMSSGGASVTALTPASPGEAVLTCDSEEPAGAQLLGFTLTGSPELGPPLVRIGLNSALTVQYCVFRDNPVDNVVVESTGFDVIIRYNVFVRNGGTSCVGVSGGRTHIFSNTFHDNNRGFYTIGGLTRASNNIVSGCAEYGAYGVFAELSYNDFWNNDPDYTGGALPGDGNLFADPLFSDAAQDDYALHTDSPCRDAGNPNPAFDDPDGTRGDIGGIPAGGYWPPVPEIAAITIGTSGDNQHVVSNVPLISWEYTHGWGYPQTAAEIEVGTDDDWTTAELWDSGLIGGEAGSITYGGASLADGQSYYARIRVYHDTLISEWTPAPFHMNTRPSVSMLLFPPNDAIILTCCPTLVTMNATDADGDVLQYDFFVSLDAEHVNIVASELGIPAGYGQTDWTVTGLTAENQRHWWCARANDGFELGPWCDSWTFWLDGYNDLPEPFDLISPADGQVEVEQQPNFSWVAASDADPGATLHYRVILADNPDFTTYTTASPDEDTVLHWPFLLSTSSEYWWMVIADDGRGGTSNSSTRSFSTTGVCAHCSYQADYDEDGFPTALDIGFMIDILFAGSPDVQDANCMVTRSDFDCDGYATSLDLGFLIDYLFVGGPGPCDPCAL